MDNPPFHCAVVNETYLDIECVVVDGECEFREICVCDRFPGKIWLKGCTPEIRVARL